MRHTISSRKTILGVIFVVIGGMEAVSVAQTAMIHVAGRRTISLNGDWPVIIDPMDAGDWRRVWEERKPRAKSEFVEYGFEGGPTLHVPGDWNTQIPELRYLEGVVWYKRFFSVTKKTGRRLFVHFGAVNYRAAVYVNGVHLGAHEGGFTPFQFELTDAIREGDNTLIVKVDNRRVPDGLPGLGYDWFNYGGITRDVHLVETPETYIEDYALRLKAGSDREVVGWVKMKGPHPAQTIRIRIPELKIDYRTRSNPEGKASVGFSGPFRLWSPDNPKRYDVIIQAETDTIVDTIGFRRIEVEGTRLLLNGKPIFFKGVNLHEERPFGGGRATSEADALVLLSWAKELGCNMVRLAHYPHNEHLVRLAETMGLMIWEELPVYQHIAFSAPGMDEKLERMMKEMIRRDRNRCAVVVWCLSNETYHFTPKRDQALITLTQKCRAEDPSRLVASVINTQGYQHHTLTVWDTLYRHFDVMALNEYLGWYVPWQGPPGETKWELVCHKPLIISEFGGEAQYGQHAGPPDEAAYWNEAYQAQVYRDQIALFDTAPHLSGVFAWLLVDYRSPIRMHPTYQKGYNRKGLLSEFGEKKEAWAVLKAYYARK